MSEPLTPHVSDQPPYQTESLRLEAVTTCVGFDDLLDVTLTANHPHVDHFIVVTSHDDTKTHAVCQKHGATCVQTDLFAKNGRQFNKGCAINAGFNYFQYFGWRCHLDVDIALPDNFRRLLFNHHALDRATIYGADRVDVIGAAAWHAIRSGGPQHQHRLLVQAPTSAPIGARFVSTLEGYLPLGFCQLWHASCQKAYPYSLGTAAHDDTMFAALWPSTRRHLLPGVIVYHLCPQAPTWSENWERRRSPRWRPS